MYGFLHFDVLRVRTAIIQTYVWLPLYGCIACSYRNCKEHKHMYGFLHLDVLRVHTAIIRRTNICMASFIWMYCMFIQQLEGE